MSPKELYETYNNELGLEINTDFSTFWSSFFVAIEESHSLLRDISKHYDIGLLTNIYEDVLGKAIQNGTIPDVKYSCTVQSCHIGSIKPEPEIYDYAQERCNVSPNKIFFIDDIAENLIYPHKLGWQTHLFDPKDPQTSVDELREKLIS